MKDLRQSLTIIQLEMSPRSHTMRVATIYAMRKRKYLKNGRERSITWSIELKVQSKL